MNQNPSKPQIVTVASTEGKSYPKQMARKSFCNVKRMAEFSAD